MAPSAMSPDMVAHDHVTTQFHHQDGLISPPSTDNDSVADTNSLFNGSDGQTDRRQLSQLDIHLSQPGEGEIHDLIGVGFGPSCVAAAISIHDKYTALKSSGAKAPKVCFLERHPEFSWHPGMQLSGAHMQISFLKDLNTPRDPRGRFTFLNYLFHNGRLNQFINLGTFLPSRVEYEDYLRWCAAHFDDVVEYGNEVVSVKPSSVDAATGKVTSFAVTSRDLATNQLVTRQTRRVVIAAGGKPNMPKELIKSHRIIPSSQYAWKTPQILTKKEEPYKIAVIGGAQSAAEVFCDVQSRYPRADVSLIVRDSALRPSDDSPFVNEIFDPDQVDRIYAMDPANRTKTLATERATNYGVVRLGLIERIYNNLYVQRVQFPNPADWKIRILFNREIRSSAFTVSKTKDPRSSGSEQVELELVGTQRSTRAGQVEKLKFDAIIVACGYVRNSHEELLGEATRSLLPKSADRFLVSRDYRVQFDPSKVDEGAGVWLLGCNEKTHGLSDSLLSIQAIRSMELVNSLFGEQQRIQLRAA